MAKKKASTKKVSRSAKRTTSTSKKSTKKTSKKPATSRKKTGKKSSRTTRSSPTRSRRSRRASLHSYTATYLWLVLIDGLLSLIMLLAGAFFGTTLGVFSIQTVVGLYGLFVFLLSIVTVFLFIRQQQPRRLLAVPIYVIIVPMILFGLSWLIDGSGQTSITLVILTWIAVLGEIALAGSQLTPDLRGW